MTVFLFLAQISLCPGQPSPFSVSTSNSYGTVTLGSQSAPPAFTATINEGKQYTITATPAPGMFFKSWRGSIVNYCSTAVCTFTFSQCNPLDAQANFRQPEITVTVSNPPATNVTSNPPGINCGLGQTICTWGFAPGSNVTLTSNPPAGAVWRGWDGSDKSLTKVIAMNGDQAITAWAEPAPPSTGKLTLNVFGTGTMHAMVDRSFDYNCVNTDLAHDKTCTYDNLPIGKKVYVNATAGSGAQFIKFTPCPGSVVNSVSCQFDATSGGPWIVQALFERPTLTVNIEGPGNVAVLEGGMDCHLTTCKADYPANKSITLVETSRPSVTVIPTSAPSKFISWTGPCAAGTDPNKCTINMSGDQTVTAKFVPRAMQRVTVSGPGKITNPLGTINCPTDCEQLADIGVQFNLLATPNAGDVFTGWSGCPFPSGSACVVTADNPGSQPQANFVKPKLTVWVPPPMVIVTSTPAGINCQSSVLGGNLCTAEFEATSVHLTAQPLTGAHVTWSTGCSGNVCDVALTKAETRVDVALVK